MGLNETPRVAYNLGETQTCNNFVFFLRLTFRSLSLASVWLEEENFQVLKRCYIQAYPTSLFFRYGKAVNLLPMWNLDWSSVKFL